MDDRGIRKKGVLKKLKRGRKRYFVLRERVDATPARLEYYEKESAFRNGAAAKRAIDLRSCLSISKDFDKKHKYLVKLFTKEDCFAIVFDSEVEREEWYLELENLQREEDDPERPHFEHIWPVNVKPKGLGKFITPGQYRLCLTRQSLSLVSSDRNYEFQLGSIRRFGHTNEFFYMEVGRSCQTGSGELWMQVEDSVIARNMHEILRCFNEKDERKRSDTISHPPTRRPDVHTGSEASNSPRIPIRTWSTAGTSCSRPTDIRRTRNNSIDSQQSHGTGGSQSDHDHDSDCSHQPFTTDYIPMEPSVDDEILADLFVPYILVSDPGEEYEHMQPDGAYIPMSPPTGYSSSPAMSNTSSQDTDERFHVNTGLTTLHEGTDGGYIPMSPTGSLTLPGGVVPRPDPVPSYVNDDSQMRDKRSYSLGSKQNKTPAVPGYMPMDIGTKLDKGGSKSSSAPHLVDKDKVTTGTQTPVSCSSCSSSSRTTDMESDELFMIMDFNRGADMRPRTSSGGKDLPPRTGGFGQEHVRKRASSFGKEFGMHRPSRVENRYRTTTICQDQFRNRTSSFGSDFRPRSHSDKLFRCTPDTPRHPSSESLRRSKRTSQESLGSLKMSNEYLDMSKPAPVPEHGPVRDGTYAEMTPGPKDNYMDMTPGSVGTSVSPTRSSSSCSDRRRPPSRSGSSAKTIPASMVHMKVPEIRNCQLESDTGDYIDIDLSSAHRTSRSTSPCVKSGSPSLSLSSSPTVKSPLAESHLDARKPVVDSYAVYKPSTERPDRTESRMDVVVSGIAEEDPITPTNTVPQAGPSSPSFPFSRCDADPKTHAESKAHAETKDARKAPPLPPMPAKSAPAHSDSDHRLDPKSPSRQEGRPEREERRVSPLPASSLPPVPHPPQKPPTSSSSRSASQPIPIPSNPHLAKSQEKESSPTSSSRESTPSRREGVVEAPFPDCPFTVLPPKMCIMPAPFVGYRPNSQSGSPETYVIGPPFRDDGVPPNSGAMPELHFTIKPPETCVIPAPFFPGEGGSQISTSQSSGSEGSLCSSNGNAHGVEATPPTPIPPPFRPAPVQTQLSNPSSDSYVNVVMRRIASDSSASLAQVVKEDIQYASLDLTSSSECMAPEVRASGSRPSLHSDSDSEPLTYSQLDFVKSDALRLNSNLQQQRETRPPFELHKM